MKPPLPMREMRWLEFTLNKPKWIFVCAVAMIFVYGLVIFVRRLNWWDEHKFKQATQKMRKTFARKFAELQKHNPNDAEARYSLQADEYLAEQQMEEWRKSLYSTRLLRKATQYDVEVPPVSDKDLWLQTDLDEVYLTLKGRDLLRDRIIQAKDRESADWARRSKIWVPLLSLLVALASIITSIALALTLKK
jgi:hypothetical protein